MKSFKHYYWDWFTKTQQAKAIGQEWTVSILKKLGATDEDIKEYFEKKKAKQLKKLQKRLALLQRISSAKKNKRF